MPKVNLEDILNEINCPADMKQDMRKLAEFSIVKNNIRKMKFKHPQLTEHEITAEVLKPFLKALWGYKE